MKVERSMKANRQWWLLRPSAIILLASIGAVALITWFWSAAPSRAGAAEAGAPQALRGIHYSPPRPAPELVGIDHNNKAFSLSRQPHPLALVFFGYVSCTDVCPTNLKKFEKIQAALGEDTDQVQFVFVSVDPENERPETMKAYLQSYAGKTIGVTGKYADSLEEAYDSWGIVRRRVALKVPVNGRDYKFDHSGQIYLVQSSEHILVSYPYGTSVETMIADIQALLNDPSLGERLPAIGAVREIAIEAGTYTRAGQDNPTLPAYLRVWVGDAIRWKNDDYMYHFIGDISLAPDESAIQRFDAPGEFYFGCTAVPSEVIRILVVAPDPKHAVAPGL